MLVIVSGYVIYGFSQNLLVQATCCVSRAPWLGHCVNQCPKGQYRAGMLNPGEATHPSTTTYFLPHNLSLCNMPPEVHFRLTPCM